MTRFRGVLVFGCCLANVLIPAAHASLVATYTFNDTLAAQQPGVAALTAVDPLGTSGFQSATVFGNLQNTYHFDGAATPPADQGGLDFNTTGLVSSDDYSVEMVVELTGDAGWRRLLDSLDRQSDDSLFSANTFFDIFVTVDPNNTVTGYFGGVQQFSETSTSLDVATNTLGFFLDNVVAGGQGEWSSGNVALIKVFNTALTADQVAAETADPFQGTSTVPEPSAWLLTMGGAAVIAILKRRS
jgi:hypothetical protein